MRNIAIRPIVRPSADWTGRHDVIIVGSGAAGLAAATELTGAGLDVALISKGELYGGSTAWAQGGLAAVLGPGDQFGEHAEDTEVAGAGLCEPDPVGRLVAAAPDTIDWLDTLGARFDRDRDGGYALGLEGGHRHRRIVHAGGDQSGAEVERALAASVRAARQTRRPSESGRLTVLDHTMAVDAVLDSAGRVSGLWVIEASGSVGLLAARAVALATGGLGQLWATTTNPATATGDGLAVALRAGAVVRDLEFVQFHPTLLVVPPDHRRPDDRGVLISEAVRGEGAVLVDGTGRPVMAGRDPRGDLAPRDVVAAAIETQLAQTGADQVYLDATRLGAARLAEHFPSIVAMCRARGVDPVHEPIPVRPAAHYSCGGVRATLDGVTSVPGLYAVGEVASTGVQGANRLASNSLTEAVLSGRLLAARLRADLQPSTADQPDAGTGPGTYWQPGPDRMALQAAMSRHCGVLRDQAGLEALISDLNHAGGWRVGQPSRADVELLNLHTVATAIADAALNRRESRGCHRRSDYPKAGDPARHQELIGTPVPALDAAVAA